KPKLNPAFDPEVTLADYVAGRFLPSNKGAWKPRTYEGNAYVLDHYVLPFPVGGARTLGDVQVRDFTRGQARAFLEGVRDLQARDPRAPGALAYAGGTLRGIYKMLRQVLNAAVEDELIEANPALRLAKLLRRPDDGEGVDVKAMDATQLGVFLATG